MLKFKLFTVYVFFETLLCGCSVDQKREGFEVRARDYVIERVGKMNKEEVMESSGIELTGDGNFWTHADGGNLPVLYKVDATGKLLKVLQVPNTANQDWEDLARDDQGHIFIGDFGNNENKRHNLRIFRVNEQNTSQVDTIQFAYADQKMFPPKKADRNFDCEAFFYHRDNLYLFTKDRGRKDLVKVYKVPAQPGSYEAVAIDSIQISTMITAADISPDGSKIALLGYGNIYICDVKGRDDFFGGNKYCIPFEKTGQAEALVFINNSDFVFTNEGGKIFKAVGKEKK
jgi:hypothetical protein